MGSTSFLGACNYKLQEYAGVMQYFVASLQKTFAFLLYADLI